MTQWPAVLVAALVAATLNYPGAAAASTKSEPSLWQRLLAAITPSAPPARAPARRARPVPAPAPAREATKPAPAPAPAPTPAREATKPAPAPAPTRVAMKPAPAPAPATIPNPVTELVAPLLSEPAPKPPERPTGASAGCGGGQRVISAYYWEGRHTASGAPFNPNAMTAAHRTLPFGTHLTVTNPRTGQSVSVVINDRGPFVRGVSLDLSRGAAQAIGLHGTGAVCIL
jgi:rare lipoprotein A